MSPLASVEAGADPPQAEREMAMAAAAATAPRVFFMVDLSWKCFFGGTLVDGGARVGSGLFDAGEADGVDHPLAEGNEEQEDGQGRDQGCGHQAGPVGGALRGLGLEDAQAH